MKDIVYLDLFSGIGGFALGFTQAGFRFKKHYFSEIDKYAIAVYKYHFKDAENIGDIRFIPKGKLKEKPDIISFGFPCQDLSIAGLRKGLIGNRSNLFYEALRLIKEYLPKIFVFENVEGLLSSHEGKDFETVLRAIADIGLYECEWQLLNTAWVLPQNRQRIYFVGHLREKSRSGIFPFTETDFKSIQRSTKTSNVKTITGGGHSGGHHSGMTLIDVGFKHHGIRYLDNFCSTLTARNHKEQKMICKPVSTPDFQNKKQNGRRIKNDGENSFTLTSNHVNGVFLNNTVRRLTEIECERLQGFPDNWTQYGDFEGNIKEISRSQRYKQIGNAVTVKWPELIGQRILNLDES